LGRAKGSPRRLRRGFPAGGRRALNLRQPFCYAARFFREKKGDSMKITLEMLLKATTESCRAACETIVHPILSQQAKFNEGFCEVLGRITTSINDITHCMNGLETALRELSERLDELKEAKREVNSHAHQNR
jgi:hypothetical protein